jgi:3-deoxy-D-manno-octulosonate 8-phosphate phosphatase KdsC-like HAD superfamily phosphatase
MTRQNLIQVGPDRIVYVGDGSAEIQVMLHVNHRDGFPIAVSEARKRLSSSGNVAYVP